MVFERRGKIGPSSIRIKRIDEIEQRARDYTRQLALSLVGEKLWKLTEEQLDKRKEQAITGLGVATLFHPIGLAATGLSGLVLWLSSDNLLYQHSKGVDLIFNDVIYNGADPAEAIQEIEKLDETLKIAGDSIELETHRNPLLRLMPEVAKPFLQNLEQARENNQIKIQQLTEMAKIKSEREQAIEELQSKIDSGKEISVSDKLAGLSDEKRLREEQIIANADTRRKEREAQTQRDADFREQQAQAEARRKDTRSVGPQALARKKENRRNNSKPRANFGLLR